MLQVSEGERVEREGRRGGGGGRGVVKKGGRVGRGREQREGGRGGGGGRRAVYMCAFICFSSKLVYLLY